MSRVKTATCDGCCHCSECQFQKDAEQDHGETFQLNTGKKCKCGRFYLALICYNRNRSCFFCSTTATSSSSVYDASNIGFEIELSDEIQNLAGISEDEVDEMEISQSAGYSRFVIIDINCFC